MPLEIKQELIDELIKRELMKERFAPRDEKSVPEQTTLSPTQALLAGGLGDALSTYTFLKRGTGVEGNAAIDGMNPLPTAVAAGAGTMGALLLREILKLKYPKLADTLAGGLGGYQTLLTAGNLDDRVPDSARNANQTLSKVIQKRRK